MFCRLKRRGSGSLFLYILDGGHELGERNFNGRVESIERNDHSELPLVIDAGYEINADSAANHDAFNQRGDMHRCVPFVAMRYRRAARERRAARVI
jgi:hypothetical protein